MMIRETNTGHNYTTGLTKISVIMDQGIFTLHVPTPTFFFCRFGNAPYNIDNHISANSSRSSVNYVSCSSVNYSSARQALPDEGDMFVSKC